MKSIAVKGAIHNVYVTPDGKYAVAGSIPGASINVIDTATNTVAWTMMMKAGIRPMAFTRNLDGSTKELIVQLSNFHGFVVIDFATRAELAPCRAAGPAWPGKRDAGHPRSAGARLSGHAGRQDAVDYQQVLRLCGRLLVARL